ncbi:MAG: NAD(P)/FAD-dependent oxidoreductase [Bdellovibrionota bacterium]|nr:NAD(P)/FAD-dependent oxidoreductase [Bdellovibrionota bacterium]
MKYDAIIIGAGMSGLAAGIRLAMFDKKVLIVEKHSIPGGLNSYYRRRIPSTKELVEFDVGLHALTNFAHRAEKGRPFTKLLKQLRIPYDAFELKQQTTSKIQFASASLRFSNEADFFLSEIEKTFPKEIDSFRKFHQFVLDYNETDLNAEYISARSILDQYFREDLLKEMLIAPLLIYGSAWEHDMDFSQFVIMYKALYVEGFSRPVGGVRTILKLLTDRYEQLGGELRYRTQVEKIETSDRVQGILTSKGEFIASDKVFSSMGLPETYQALESDLSAPVGKLSFCESIFVTKDKSHLDSIEDTIVFFNKTDKYLYRKPENIYDNSSAVFCLPDNYERDTRSGYGTIRVTYMADYAQWIDKEEPLYKDFKQKLAQDAKELSSFLMGTRPEILLEDVFTPRTIKKYTNHIEGTVYGSTQKNKNGKTSVEGLYIIGTDQGFLGIVGSMLSGISMANIHGLMND